MTFTITHPSGEMDVDPSDDMIDRLIDELDAADAEHPDISLSHESGWTLSAYSNGTVVWENVIGGPPPRHRRHVGQPELRQLMRSLAKGDIAQVESAAWAAGYGRSS